jgi:Ni,Fe-hydrogenase III small subunit/ferredoxin
MEQTVKPRLFRINTGSCNGCDVEFVATAFVPKFHLEELGIELVERIEDANMLLITGPMTARSQAFFEEAVSKVKPPYVVVGVGTCSVTTGIFRDSYAIYGPLDKYIDVDVNVAGCPPRPQAIAEAIAQGVEILQYKLLDQPMPKKLETIFTDFEAPESYRGRVSLDAQKCTACRTCETVCPSGAIKITKTLEGYEHTIWHNTCCFCGNCAYYCPTGAIFTTNDFHTVQRQEEKYLDTHVALIPFHECEECGKNFIPATTALIERAYPNAEVPEMLTNSCPECRKRITFERCYQ